MFAQWKIELIQNTFCVIRFTLARSLFPIIFSHVNRLPLASLTNSYLGFFLSRDDVHGRFVFKYITRIPRHLSGQCHMNHGTAVSE